MVLPLFIMTAIMGVITAPGLIALSIEDRRKKKAEEEQELLNA